MRFYKRLFMKYKRDGVTEDFVDLESSKFNSGEDINKFIEKYFDFNKVFDYCKESPSFLKWKVNNYSANIGDIAGTLGSYNKYGDSRWTVGVCGAKLKAHRVIYIMFNDSIYESNVIDHIDGNPLNNSISNLRSVPKVLNLRNVGLRRNSKTGKTGVSTTIDNGIMYYIAHWNDEFGKNKCRWFSTVKYGDDAFTLACQERDKQISRLKEIGLGYTDRHGSFIGDENGS